MIREAKKPEKKTIDKAIISKIVNIALATSKIKRLVVEENNGEKEFRPNINILIHGEVGSTKSTLLNQISKSTGSKKPFTDLTYPALIGSVDKITRQLIVGSCWECRNKLLLLDEFDFGQRKKDTIRTLLQLAEGGEYNKKIASFAIPKKEIDDDLSYEFNDGEFNVKTRFSLVVCTMKNPYISQNIELRALVSRCISLPFYPTKETLMQIAHGYPLFEYKPHVLDKFDIKIKNEDYNIITSHVDKKSDGTNYLRIIGDCVRIFAVLQAHDYELYDLIIELGSRKFS